MDDRHHIATQEAARGAHVHIHASDQVMKTATTMFREMDLRFLQEQAEAAKLA